MKQNHLTVLALACCCIGTVATLADDTSETRDKLLRQILSSAATTDAIQLKKFLSEKLESLKWKQDEETIRNTVLAYVSEKLGGPGASTPSKTTPAKEETKKPSTGAESLPEKAKEDSKGAKAKPLALDVLGPVDFGAGIGFMVDLGPYQRVKNATVDKDGFIRGKQDDHLAPVPILETHVFPFKKQRPFGYNTEFDFGPYIGIVPGGERVIQAIGGGLMLSARGIGENPEFKPGDADNPQFKQKPGSFQIGVGVMIEPGVEILGSGLRLDQKIGANDTLRFRDKDMIGVQVILSLGY